MTSHFIWYELLTTDPDAAATFYGTVLGWAASGSGQAGMDYRTFTKDGVAVGGHMALSPGAVASGMPPCWLGYVSVADVDKSVAAVLAAGGAVYMPAMDIPNVGRFALVADPQGASFYVMTAAGQGPATSFAPSTPGHGGWHELHTTDWKAALAFYGAQFGWKESRAMDMGPMGTYLLFNVGAGDAVGGMVNNAEAPRPFWLYYFNVADIEQAGRLIAANGGRVLMGPHQVPTGSWIVQAQDPQGAMFALVGPKV
ncbi:MAG: VOC family protein [Acidobacteriota bacterium]